MHTGDTVVVGHIGHLGDGLHNLILPMVGGQENITQYNNATNSNGKDLKHLQ